MSSSAATRETIGGKGIQEQPLIASIITGIRLHLVIVCEAYDQSFRERLGVHDLARTDL